MWAIPHRECERGREGTYMKNVRRKQVRKERKDKKVDATDGGKGGGSRSIYVYVALPTHGVCEWAHVE